MLDPNLPQAGTEIDSVQIRSQLTSLKALIDAIPAGPAGPPGEVTYQDLDNAINGTANNCDVVTPLDITISDPPAQYEVEQILWKLNELIQNLHRNV